VDSLFKSARNIPNALFCDNQVSRPGHVLAYANTYVVAHVERRSPNSSTPQIQLDKNKELGPVRRGMLAPVGSHSVTTTLLTTGDIPGQESYTEIRLRIEFGRLDYFQGRTEILSRLRDSLITYSKDDSTRAFVLWGQAGSGKSTICDKFYSQNQNQ
jgi:hypothetical protein